jgi:hypothetical protein
MKSFTPLFILLWACFLAIAKVSVAAPINPKFMIMKNDSADATDSSNKSTFCIGRFLIDAPSNSRLGGGNYKYDFQGIEQIKAMTFDNFEKEIDRKEAVLKAAKHKTEPSLLRVSRRPEKNTRILAFWEEDVVTSVVNIEGYRWMNGNAFYFKGEVSTNKQDAGLKRMQEALSLLHPRSDVEFPAEPGYCFAGGFIANPRWRNEEARVDIDIAGHPDAFVSVWIYPLASHKHDKPLLERMGGLTQALGGLATSVHVLRKGDRQIGPYKGQEHLASAPNSGGMRGHAFVWETQGEGTLDTPAIKIELTTGHQDSKGNPQKTSLTDQQAMKLWDDVLNSFRLRPTGENPQTSGLHPDPQPGLPLGELVATGRRCPQTGWWQTTESGEVEGGRRQRFVAGEQMPEVVLLQGSSVWQKLKGKRPSHRIATLWKLVEFDDTHLFPQVPPPLKNTSSTLTSAQQAVNASPEQNGDTSSRGEG